MPLPVTVWDGVGVGVTVRVGVGVGGTQAPLESQKLGAAQLDIEAQQLMLQNPEPHVEPDEQAVPGGLQLPMLL